jgi:hypothetical protein
VYVFDRYRLVAPPVRVRECLLDVVVILMTLALCVLCTGTLCDLTCGAISNDKTENSPKFALLYSAENSFESFEYFVI